MTRVWVTRDEPPDGPLSTALRRAGLEPLTEPVLIRRIVADVSALISGLRPDDWLVLTSGFAIASIHAEAVNCRVAVVGDLSRAAAAARGLAVELLSPDGTGEGLWRALRAIGPRRVVYPRSSLAVAPEPWPGVEIVSPVLYETVPWTIDRTRLAGAEVAAVASPSAVAAAVRIAPDLKFASIGPTTEAALRRLGVAPWAQAATPSFESLAAAILARLTGGAAGPDATTRRTPEPRT